MKEKMKNNLFTGNLYSCQICQALIESEQELQITIGFSPLCSKKCEFRLAYKILMKYPNSLLKEMWNMAFLNTPLIKEKQKVVFNLTKFFMNKK